MTKNALLLAAALLLTGGAFARAADPEVAPRPMPAEAIPAPAAPVPAVAPAAPVPAVAPAPAVAPDAAVVTPCQACQSCGCGGGCGYRELHTFGCLRQVWEFVSWRPHVCRCPACCHKECACCCAPVYTFFSCSCVPCTHVITPLYLLADTRLTDHCWCAGNGCGGGCCGCGH
jgi:hypothetical protein